MQVFMVNYFSFYQIEFVFIHNIAMCDLMQDVQAVFHLS